MAARKKAARSKKTTRQSARSRKPGSARPTRRKPPKGSKGGKPRIELDVASIQRLAEKGNTNETIACILDVSEATLQARIADTPEVARAIKLGNAKLDRSLRTWQVRAAQKLQPAILIWMGKQRLGQRDVRAVELTGGQGGPVSFMAELAPVLEQKLVEFLRNRKAAEADPP